MPEDQKSGFSEAVETGASAAHTIRGAIKTGKAISSAAKGAAAGGPYGAVAGAVWAGRKHIGKIIVAVIALLMLPVLFVLMLPGLIFGGLTNAFSPSDPEIPILNSETAIIENANEITFTLNGILGEALDDVLARIEADFAASGADHTGRYQNQRQSGSLRRQWLHENPFVLYESYSSGHCPRRKWRRRIADHLRSQIGIVREVKRISPQPGLLCQGIQPRFA